MRGVESLVARIDDPRLWKSEPAHDDEIRKAEKALGVSFPPSYRAFLSLYGAMSVGDVTISGVIDNAPLDSGSGSVVFDTMTFRKDWRLPERYVVIQPSDEAPYCLDAQRSDAAGEMVVVCYELHSEHAGVIATSFLDWLDRFYVGSVT